MWSVGAGRHPGRPAGTGARRGLHPDPEATDPVPDILRAYDAVSDWLQQRGERLALAPREVYFTDMAAAADDDPAADIAFPYATSS